MLLSSSQRRHFDQTVSTVPRESILRFLQLQVNPRVRLPSSPAISFDILTNSTPNTKSNSFASSLYNSSVYVYDISTGTGESITFEHITLNPRLHLSGVRKNPVSGLLSIIVDAGAAFVTGGADTSGDNFLIQYDLKTKTEVSRTNLTETTQGRYGGFQDVEFDSAGNIYVVGTYPSSILKVDPSGSKVEVWYLAEPVKSTVAGIGGLAVVGNTLLGNDIASGNVVRFDLTSSTGTPIVVPHSPAGVITKQGDGITLPEKFHGTVLLIAQNGLGFAVLRSNDTWQTAEFLGTIPHPASVPDGALTASVQIEGSVYANVEFFGDAPGAPPIYAGNRTVFPLIDITESLEALLL